MKGKILFSILALGASSVVLANGGLAPAPAAAPEYFDGFVVGLEGGMQHLAGNVKDNASQVSSDETTYIRQKITQVYFASDTNSLDNDVADNTLSGGLFAGYGKVFNSAYYIGGELYGRYAHNTINTHSSGVLNLFQLNTSDPNWTSEKFSTSINVDSDWSFGGALKLGYLVTPKTMIYLLAGVENSRFKVDVNHTVSDPKILSNGIPFPWSTNYSFSENRWAFVPGIGIETMLSDNLSLKAEYTYADYGSFSNDNTAHSSSVIYDATTNAVIPTIKEQYDTTLSSNDKVKLNRGLFTLGLSYHFNGI